MPKIVDFISFEIGPVPKAHLTVLYHVTDASFKRKQLYEVKYDCCGNTGRLTHTGILSRIAGSTKFCISCGQKNGQATKRKNEIKLEVAKLEKSKLSDVESFSTINVPWKIPSAHVELSEVFPNQI